MKTEILNFILLNTEMESMQDLTTKQVASKFGISTKKAFDILSGLAKDELITKLDPVNDDNFSCCGWIRNHDEEEPETIKDDFMNRLKDEPNLEDNEC